MVMTIFLSYKSYVIDMLNSFSIKYRLKYVFDIFSLFIIHFYIKLSTSKLLCAIFFLRLCEETETTTTYLIPAVTALLTTFVYLSPNMYSMPKIIGFAIYYYFYRKMIIKLYRKRADYL